MVLRSMIPRGLALLHLLLVLSSASASASELPPAAAVRVGVVLDLTSEAGRKSLTCISMALDAFYSAHANSSWRVHLLVGDTRGDVVAAAHAGKAGFIFFFFLTLKIAGGKPDLHGKPTQTQIQQYRR